jgi:hypothetical protein
VEWDVWQLSLEAELLDAKVINLPTQVPYFVWKKRLLSTHLVDTMSADLQGNSLRGGEWKSIKVWKKT